MKRFPTSWQVVFDRRFLCNEDLNPAEKSIILALAGWADMTLRANPTRDQLCAGSGLGRRQLYDHLQCLRERGYIDWEAVRMNGRYRNVYQVLPACGICMVGWSRSSMQFPHASLQKMHTPKPRPRKTAAIIPFPRIAATPKKQASKPDSVPDLPPAG